MGKQPQETNFEAKLAALEELTSRLESGEMGLEELLKVYEQGIILAGSLQKDLEQAQGRLLELRGGTLSPAQEP